ncbi:MAG: CvpA family protein [Clostridia bacterium]|nr:CvpA family protein [Clostridia bacterium]
MNPSTILDIVLGVTACLVIIKFTVEGFFQNLLDLCKGFLAIVISYLMRIAIGRLFCSLFMKDAMITLVSKSLDLYQNQDVENLGFDIASLKENTPEFFEKILTRYGLDYQRFLGDFEEFFVDGNHEVKDSLAENVGGAVAMLVSIILALFVGLIVAYVLLSIVVYFILKLTKFDGVKTANRWLGLALGVVIAFLVLWGATIVVELLVQFVGPVLPEYINPSLAENSMVVGMFKIISPINFIKDLIYS